MRRLYSKEDIIENRMISVMYREDPKDSPVHTHDFLEIIYIIEGRAIHNCKGKQTPITKGNYFLIDYNSEHQIVCKSHDFKVITCTFVPEFIDDSLWGCGGIIAVFKNYNINLLPHPSIDFYSFNDDNGSILNILEAMIDEYKRTKPGYLSFLRSYLIQLLLFTIRKFDTLTPEFDKRIEEIIEYTDCHYAEHITLEQLCRDYYCSVSNISILFKSQTGITFSEYLKETRIKKSCKLLTNSDKSIEEIANAVGYNDTRTFRKHFKLYFGITPLKFRKISHANKQHCSMQNILEKL